MMGKSDPEDSTERNPGEQAPKRFTITFGSVQLLLCSAGLVFVLAWIFALGILIGRGTSLVSSRDLSPQAEFLRIIGLGRETAQPSPNAAETWDAPSSKADPQKGMLESLSYYDDLTKKNITSLNGKPGTPTSGSKDAGSELSGKNKTTAGRQTKTSGGDNTTDEASGVEVGPGSSARLTPGSMDRFTLLVASNKDDDFSNKLLDQLKSKGYAPRLESLDLNGGGKWNRVVVGSFESKETALRFAAEFNRKEKMEGLVVRDVN